MLKSVLKFLGILAGIAVLGMAALFGMEYLRYRSSPEYQAGQDLENLKKQYAEDTYGGDTPEETLRLFISALKKGDTELAAKYFVLDKQEQWREDLALLKEKGLLNDSIKDLERLTKKYPLGNAGNRFIFEFETREKSDELTLQADIARGPNGKWKILDL